MHGLIAGLIIGASISSIVTAVFLYFKAGHALRKQEKNNEYRRS